MAALYDEYFRFMQVRTLERSQGSVVWRYPLLVSPGDRDALLQVLWKNDVFASRWYPSLDTMLAALVPAIEKQTSPGAEQLGAEIINLPVDHTVDEEMIKRTTEIIQAYFQKSRMSF
jgi:dTDP-4-amino-4,6-dideoxygalactose transaminase